MRLSVNKLTVHRAGINRLAIELILIPSRGCTTDPPHDLDRRWRSRRHNSGIDHNSQYCSSRRRSPPFASVGACAYAVTWRN